MNQDDIVAAIAVIAGGVVAVAVVLKRLKRRRARGWPTVTGQVESTLVRLQETGDNQSMWIAAVKYRYEAEAQSHSGSLERTFLMKGHAEKWLLGYATGRPLTVRINPQKAADSVVLDKEQT